MVLPYWIHNVDHVHNISTSNDKQYAQQAIEQIYEELESVVLQCAQLVIKQTCQKQGPVVRRFLYIYICTFVFKFIHSYKCPYSLGAPSKRLQEYTPPKVPLPSV